jgi:hypothetical protein
LRAHTGVELPAAILHFDPVALAPLPGRSSCGLEVHCETPAGTPPGRYVTMILASGLPGLHLPLIVVVPEQDPGR